MLVVSLLLVVSSSAQTGTSRITGTVFDVNGQVIAGATVTATNEATGISHTQATTSDGVFAFTIPRQKHFSAQRISATAEVPPDWTNNKSVYISGTSKT